MEEENEKLAQYEKIINEADSEIEKLRENLDEKEDDYNSFPEPQQKDNFFKFLRQMLNTQDSKKIANLHNTELGTLPKSVRKYCDLAVLSSQLGYPKISDYYLSKAEIINATSMSRKGFFSKLMVTKIRSSENNAEVAKEPNQKTSWFNFKKGGENEQF